MKNVKTTKAAKTFKTSFLALTATAVVFSSGKGLEGSSSVMGFFSSIFISPTVSVFVVISTSFSSFFSCL